MCACVREKTATLATRRSIEHILLKFIPSLSLSITHTDVNTNNAATVLTSVGGASAEVEHLSARLHLAQVVQSGDVSRSKVAHVDVVSGAGTVPGLVVVAEHAHAGALANSGPARQNTYTYTRK